MELEKQEKNNREEEFSKFNYLFALVHGEPKNCILGLPHTAEGYLEARKILERPLERTLRYIEFGVFAKHYKCYTAESKTIMTFIASCLET